MGRNPYATTYIQREKAKSGSGGGMKSTKAASKAKPMTKAKSKSMPVKKSVAKSTKK
jgi:hypothetical protein